MLCAWVACLTGSAYSASVPNAVTFAIADDAAQRAFPSELTSARGVGFGAARAYVGWADVALRRPAHPRDPADPAYDWAQTDADMARYGAAGLQVWVTFWRTPAWASGSNDPAAWAANPNDLGDFAFAVAKRYPQVKVFLNWNEPNLKGYATPNTIEAYEPMARAVYAAVKAASPGAEVIAGNLGMYRDNGRDPARWAARLRSDGVPMDAFGVNPYPPASAPLSSRSPLARIDLFDVPALARIVGVPVAVTEFGWSSLRAGTAHQATWTAQAIAVARCTPGLSQFVFWGYHDHPVPVGETPSPWVTFGWLDATGAPKPVYDAGRSALAGTPDCATIGQAAGAPPGWPDTNTIPPGPDTAPVCAARTFSVVSGGRVPAAPACSDFDGDALAYRRDASVERHRLSVGCGLHLRRERRIHRYGRVHGVRKRRYARHAGDVHDLGDRAGHDATRGDGERSRHPHDEYRVGRPSCASSAASCTGIVSLAAILNGTLFSLGTQQVTLAPLQKADDLDPDPDGDEDEVRSYAGKTISIGVTFTTTGSDGTQHPATTTLEATVPR